MHNNSATTRRGPKRTSTATSASRKPPANSELRWKNASESVSRNIPGTAPNGRPRAHDERLSLPENKAEPLLLPGCTGLPADLSFREGHRCSYATFAGLFFLDILLFNTHSSISPPN